MDRRVTHLFTRVDTETEFEVEHKNRTREEFEQYRQIKETDENSAKHLELLKDSSLMEEDFWTETTSLNRPQLNRKIGREVFEFESQVAPD